MDEVAKIHSIRKAPGTQTRRPRTAAAVDEAFETLEQALDEHEAMARALADALRALAGAGQSVRVLPSTMETLGHELCIHVDGLASSMDHARDCLARARGDALPRQPA
jgi:hypothetical protein